MQNVTGSVDTKKERKLTPFEQADYNLAKFVINAQLSEQLQAAVDQLQALEILEEKYETAIKNSETFIMGVSHGRRLADIKDEMAAVEFLIKTICIAYEHEE